MAEASSETLEITFKGEGVAETKLRLKSSTKLGKAIKAVTDKHGLDPAGYKFMFGQDKVRPDDTPAALGMENGAVVNIVVEQSGGGRR